jgi:outer membrane lipoprotein-sorting protein
MPAAVRASIKPLEVVVDKRSLQFLHLGVTGPGGSVSVDLTDQKFNAPLANSEFRFTLPPGAKEHAASPGAPGRVAPSPAPPHR